MLAVLVLLLLSAVATLKLRPLNQLDVSEKLWGNPGTISPWEPSPSFSRWRLSQLCCCAPYNPNSSSDQRECKPRINYSGRSNENCLASDRKDATKDKEQTDQESERDHRSNNRVALPSLIGSATIYDAGGERQNY